MKLLDGHLDATPKSLGAIASAIVAIALAWGFLTPDRAASVSALVSAVCALVVPDRNAGRDA